MVITLCGFEMRQYHALMCCKELGEHYAPPGFRYHCTQKQSNVMLQNIIASEESKMANQKSKLLNKVIYLVIVHFKAYHLHLMLS